MKLWIHWCNAIWLLRPACSRLRTFLWFAICVAGLTVRTDLPADLPLVEFDAGLIERVLVNLLENAAKYAGRGAVVRIRGQSLGARVRLDVTDTGPGIAPALLDPALARFLEEHHAADSQKLRSLIRNARREQGAALPPKSYRELFRVLRETITKETATDA